jgi:hypothetical protein
MISMPEILRSQHKNNHLSVVCWNSCRTCVLQIDGQSEKEIEPFVDSRTRFYRFDDRFGSVEMAWPPLFDENGVEEPVCFRYDLFPDGTASEMIVDDGDTVYDLPSYFGQVRTFASLDEAVDSKRELSRRLFP